jgi:choline dehydrogenase-like flavoprotein
MCIVIDANAASDVANGTDAAKPILNKMAKGNLRVVAGAKLKRELLRTNFRGIYRQMVLAGRLIEFEEATVTAEEIVVRAAGCRSDDPHVLALARVSGARILFSRDQRLHTDFKNEEIIRPKGSVYQDSSHQHLLHEDACSC